LDGIVERVELLGAAQGDAGHHPILLDPHAGGVGVHAGSVALDGVIVVTSMNHPSR
jgi:hypothetical protein